MSQWVKMLDAKPDNLRSVLRTHVMEGKNNKLSLANSPLTPTHVPWYMCIHTHTERDTHILNK